MTYDQSIFSILSRWAENAKPADRVPLQSRDTQRPLSLLFAQMSF